MARGSEEFLGRVSDVLRRSGVADAELLIARIEQMARTEHVAAIDAAVREAQVYRHVCSEGHGEKLS